MVYTVNSKKKLKAEKPNKRLFQNSRPELKKEKTKMMAEKMKLKNPGNIPRTDIKPTLFSTFNGMNTWTRLKQTFCYYYFIAKTLIDLKFIYIPISKNSLILYIIISHF